MSDIFINWRELLMLRFAGIVLLLVVFWPIAWLVTAMVNRRGRKTLARVRWSTRKL